MFQSRYKFLFVIASIFVLTYFAILPTNVLGATYYTANNGVDTPSYSSDFTNYKGEIFQLGTYAILSTSTINIYNCYGTTSTAKFVIATQNGTIQASSTFTVNGASGCSGGYAPTITFTPKQFAPGFYFFGVKSLTGDSFALYSNTDAVGNAGKFTWNGTSNFYCANTETDCTNQFIDNKDISGTILGTASFTSSTWANSPLSIMPSFPSSTINFATTTNCRNDLTFSSFLSSSTLQAFGCLFFVPHPNTLSFLNDNFNKFTNVFPFSLFFNTLNLARSYVENYSNSNPSLVIPLGPSGGFMGSSTPVVFSSSTFVALIGQNAYNNYWEAMQNLIHVLTIGFIIFTIV